MICFDFRYLHHDTIKYVATVLDFGPALGAPFTIFIADVG